MKGEFKNLPSGWSRYELGEICKISSSKFDPTKNSEVKKCIELEHLSQKTGQILGFISSSEQKSIKNEFRTGQILYGKLRPYLQKFCQAKFDGVCSSEIWVLQGKKVTNDFLFYLVQSDKFNQIANKTSGTKMPRADWEYMSEMPFFIPLESEQEKIAEILSTWDEAINLTINLIENKKQFKKALMQNLLTAKIRFPEFKDEWREIKLGRILKERKTYKNKGFDLEHVSLTKDGVVPKSERYDRDFLVKDDNKQYKITKLNDICYNPANLKFGVICKNTYGNGIFSPIYVTFECCNELDNNFAGFYLTQNDFIQKVRKFEEGTVYERMAVSPGDFLRFKIKLPNLKEQQKIAEVLTACDDEINLLNLKLSNLKKQKQGLMQKLLSGKARVKVKGEKNVRMDN